MSTVTNVIMIRNLEFMFWQIWRSLLEEICTLTYVSWFRYFFSSYIIWRCCIKFGGYLYIGWNGKNEEGSSCGLFQDTHLVVLGGSPRKVSKNSWKARGSKWVRNDLTLPWSVVIIATRVTFITACCSVCLPVCFIGSRNLFFFNFF
jgi:hypothetical protein